MKDREKGRSFLELMIIWLILGGVALIAGNLMADGQTAYGIFLVGALFAAGFVFCHRFLEYSNVVYIAAFAIAILMIAVRAFAVLNMGLTFMNRIITVWNNTFQGYQSLYAVSSAGPIDALYFSVITGILLAIILSYAVWKKWIAFLSVFIFTILLGTFSLGISGTAIAVILLGLGWLAAWSYDTIKIQKFLSSSLLMCGLILVLGGILLGILGGYQGLEGVTNLKNSMKKEVRNIRYGKDSLPQGDLSVADQMLGKGTDANTLELNFDTIGELHLKGFVGAEYNGDHWSTLSNQDYFGDQEGMLDWLGTQNFDPVRQYASYKIEQDKYGLENSYIHDNSYDGQEINVTVKNNGANRQYVYLPETVTGVEDGHAASKQDWQTQAAGLLGDGNYGFTAITGIVPTEIMTEPGWLANTGDEELETYATAEQVYRTFVYRYYTDISDSEKALMNQVFFSGDSWKNQDTQNQNQVYTATSRIRTILNATTTYAPQPESLPEGKDFVSWFLTENQKGNSVHYATAAVLAYRALGIPARYVEGYYVTDGKAAELNNNHETTLQMTQADGHAWVEIYADGIGWMPLEVTPGFYTELYSAQNYIELPEEEVAGGSSNNKISTAEQYNPIKKEEEKEELPVPIRIIGWIMLALLVVAFIIAVLELQRAIRCQIWKNHLEDAEDPQFSSWIFKDICRIAKCKKIKSGFAFPYQMTDVIAEQYSNIKKEEYERVVKLLQKATFGGKPLKANEVRTMRKFLEKMTKETYKEGNFWKKVKFRYINAV